MRTALLVLPLLAILSACASAGAGSTRALAPGVPATLSPGESATLPDASRLTYVGVRNDSRCPPRVQCIQAGSATVAFRHDAGGAAHEVVLVTGKQDSAELGAWRLTLAALDFGTPPRATVRIDAR